MMRDDFMDLDLNQQLPESPLWSSLNEPETCNSGIGHRIRFLEAVTGRAIQRCRHEQQPGDHNTRTDQIPTTRFVLKNLTN